MPAADTLVADADQLGAFVRTLFKHHTGGHVLLRSFPKDQSKDAVLLRSVHVDPSDRNLGELIEAAARSATKAARHREEPTFAPPVAVFASGATATQANLANGLVLSVELDKRPAEGLDRLTSVLGAPTIVMASGSDWVDPSSGEVQPRLHAHWRLAEPTTTADGHARLKHARQLAAAIVGGDRTAIPLVHPLRWAGSWNRKGEPRLARIITHDPNREIELESAVASLSTAAELMGVDTCSVERMSAPPGEPLSRDDLLALADAIPNPDLDWHEWNTVGLAFYRSSDGSADGLEAFERWSEKSDKANDGTAVRWEHFDTSPPTKIGPGSLIYRARQADPEFVLPSKRQFRSDPAADFEPLDGEEPTGFMPSFVLTPAQWAEREVPTLDPIIGHLLTSTCRVLMSADTGIGKTMFGLALAFAAWKGEGFLHWSAGRRARVLYLDGEMPAGTIKRRLELACGWLDIDSPPAERLHVVSTADTHMPPLDTAEGQKWLDSLISCLGGLDLIIFDNLQALTSQSLKDGDSWRGMKDWAHGLSARRIGQLWLHHTGIDASRGYGDKAREWGMDTVMIAEKAELNGAGVAFNLKFTKARNRDPDDPDSRASFSDVKIELRGGCWTHGLADPKATTRALGKNEQIVYDAFRTVLSRGADLVTGVTDVPFDASPVTRQRWLDEATACLPQGTERRRRQAFTEAAESLRKRGMIDTTDTFAWLVG